MCPTAIGIEPKAKDSAQRRAKQTGLLVSHHPSVPLSTLAPQNSLL